MNSIIRNIVIIISAASLLTACFDSSKPNYQYMPNMYESVGYETYKGFDKTEETKIMLFDGVSEALLPPVGSVSRGWTPYEFANTLEDKELARMQPSPLDSLMNEENLAKGKELYDIYCAICHGPKGAGQGHLVKREKILGVPSYADAARNITAGSTFHTMYYGLNSMGSYASQFSSQEEMWQVSEYVMKLKEDLSK